jgi:hypothetical protein
MILSPLEARDNMFQMVNDILPTINALLTYNIDVRWQNVANSNKLPVDKLWLRVLKQELNEDRKYVSTADNTNRVYTHTGILSIEIFGPIGSQTSWDLMQSCGQLLRNKFRVPSSIGIKFNNVRIVEVPNDSIWYKLNVIINYEYDEHGVI